jgi:hypothetical protein
MSVERRTPTLDAMAAMLRQLGRTKQLTPDSIEGLSSESRMKLARLQSTGRPFLKVTAAMKAAITRQFGDLFRDAVLKSGSIRTDAFWTKVGAIAKRIVLLRFKQQGGDITLRPLKAATIYKKTHGDNPENAHKIGIDSGDLLDDLESATFVFEDA